MISAINYIHSLCICHRDLKPENLLIDYDGALKMVDFGLSNMYEPGGTLKTACGSPCYAAPEVSLNPTVFHTFKSIDGCRESISWLKIRSLELWSRSLCNALWVFAL